VRVVDLMPTALELLGAPAPTGVPGRSLTPLIAGAVPTLDLEGYAEAMYPLHHYGWSELRALRAGRYKLIDAPRPELFDLENDPGELRNLFEERRALGERMVGRMRELEAALEAAKTEQAPVDVDPEVRARLAALGYVGSFVASAGDTRTDRADPKDKVHIFNQLSQVREKMADPDGFKEVVAMLTGIVDEDPQVIDAWFNLGNVHFKVGRFKEAITNYQRALGLKPDYDLAVINMAAAYRNLGDDEAAIAGFEHYLRIDPKDAYVRYQLGEIHLDRGEAAVAERWFREALDIDPRVAQAKNALAVLAFQRGNVAESERLVAEAIALRSDVKLARYNRALIAESRGDLRSAEREYLEELKLHPDSYKAAFNLSRIYEASGQRTLQVDALKMAIEGNPRFAEGHLFLAKAYRDQGQNLSEAIELARKAVELKPRAELRPLAHYLLAELYDRAGRRAEALREAAKAQALGGPGA
jgi:tetratricopeptide (TPR) repeat protein